MEKENNQALYEGEDAGRAISRLYDPIMRNDKSALEKALQILSDNTYEMAAKRLRAYGICQPEALDDVMQEIRMEVMKLAFRGFPEKVTSEGFYGYLIGLAEICCQNYRKRHFAKKEFIPKEPENGIFETGGESEQMESAYIEQERLSVIRRIFEFYVKALKETKAPPYQTLTYCYAILVPQLIKRTDNKELLKKLNVIGARKTDGDASRYNEKTGRLEGEITRNSVILMNFAISAMYRQTSELLNREVLEIYHLEPLSESQFRWGRAYEENMEKEYKGSPVKQLVITDTFSKNAMKNWPLRIAKNLKNETEKLALADNIFRKKSIGIAEDIFCRREG